MRLALPVTIAALLFGLLAGCGGGSSSTGTSGGGGGGGATPEGAAEGPPGASAEDCGAVSLRVSGVSCGQGEAVLASWSEAPGCQVLGGASHASCQVRGYLCIAARVQRGIAVSCAEPGESIFFIERK